eukprot:SAG31_NODE_25372_length_462_cov_1.212121_1_plen_24_part_10
MFDSIVVLLFSYILVHYEYISMKM